MLLIRLYTTDDRANSILKKKVILQLSKSPTLDHYIKNAIFIVIGKLVT